MTIKNIIKSPLMLILFPLDYIGWNLINSAEHGRVTMKDSWNECWKELSG